MRTSVRHTTLATRYVCLNIKYTLIFGAAITQQVDLLSDYQYTRATRIVSAQFTRALAEASLGLQHLSVAL